MCSSVLFACRNNWNSSQLHVHLIALGFLVWVFNRGSKIGILLIMQFNFFSLEWASSLTKAPNFFNQYLVGQPLFYSCGWVLHKWLSFFFVKDLACVPQKFLLIKTNFFFFFFQWTNLLNPENIKGLSAISMLLAMIGNGLMIPRALLIRDLMWYVFPLLPFIE